MHAFAAPSDLRLNRLLLWCALALAKAVRCLAGFEFDAQQKRTFLAWMRDLDRLVTALALVRAFKLGAGPYATPGVTYRRFDVRRGAAWRRRRASDLRWLAGRLVADPRRTSTDLKIRARMIFERIGRFDRLVAKLVNRFARPLQKAVRLRGACPPPREFSTDAPPPPAAALDTS